MAGRDKRHCSCNLTADESKFHCDCCGFKFDQVNPDLIVQHCTCCEEFSICKKYKLLDFKELTYTNEMYININNDVINWHQSVRHL